MHNFGLFYASHRRTTALHDSVGQIERVKGGKRYNTTPTFINFILFALLFAKYN